MATLLLDQIDTVATFDEQRAVLKNAWIFVRDNRIEKIGAGRYEGEKADLALNLTGYVVLPGLVNLHHHFFQALLRNIPGLQDASLFRWLHTMRLLMSEVRDEDLYIASKINIAELLLSGCTTTVDHNYLKVNDMTHDTGIKAAQEMGIRFHLARGSRSLCRNDGTAAPVQGLEKEDDILSDTERLIKSYHDPNYGAMVRIENAPGSLFSTTDRVWVESIALARRYGVGNHTHMAEAPDEERYVLDHFGKRSVERAEELGWVGEDVWYAHATMLDENEKAIIKRTGSGICNCPTSNMYTSAKVCAVSSMLREGGFKIGLGVDGSAANNSSNLLKEARQALLMQRAFFGSDALSPTQALEIGILGGARVLRREDIGVLAPGKVADIIGVNFCKLPFAGGLHDPLAGLILCEVSGVDLSIINGKIRVMNGELVGVDLPALVKNGNQRAASLVSRTEKRYHTRISTGIWRRAFPFDEIKEVVDVRDS